MRYLLDTDSVSYALRGQGGVGGRITSHRPSQLCISSITLAELRFGADRRRSRKLHGLIDAFISAVEVAPFDEKARAARGTPIGELDGLIAAHAVSLRSVLVTNNLRHFSKVPGLKVENWL